MIRVQRKVGYRGSGSGTKTANVIIPKEYFEAIGIDEDGSRLVNIELRHNGEIVLTKFFGEFYYPDNKKDLIDRSCKWANIQIDEKIIKCIFGEDNLFLGFKEKEDVKFYNERLESKFWEEYKDKGVFL